MIRRLEIDARKHPKVSRTLFLEGRALSQSACGYKPMVVMRMRRGFGMYCNTHGIKKAACSLYGWKLKVAIQAFLSPIEKWKFALR